MLKFVRGNCNLAGCKCQASQDPIFQTHQLQTASPNSCSFVPQHCLGGVSEDAVQTRLVLEGQGFCTCLPAWTMNLASFFGGRSSMST